MVLPSIFEIQLEADPAAMTYLHVMNTGGLISDAAIPLQPMQHADYNAVGGRVVAEYARSDSPSRLQSEAPYNVTLYNELRRTFPESMELLLALRGAYLSRRGIDDSVRPKPDVILDIYGMGVSLPAFLHARTADRYPNGTIPSHTAMLRQGLLGIGSIITFAHKDELKRLDGSQIVEIAEREGELIGPETSQFEQSDLEQTVCPASRRMIELTSDTLLDGQSNKDIDPGEVLAKLDLDPDLKDLERFQRASMRQAEVGKELIANYARAVTRHRAGVINTEQFGSGSMNLLDVFGREITKIQASIFKSLGRNTYKRRLERGELMHDKPYLDVVLDMGNRFLR